eukprot:s5660_g1.t1
MQRRNEATSARRSGARTRPASGRRWEDWDNDKSKDQGQPALDEPTVHLLKNAEAGGGNGSVSCRHLLHALRGYGDGAEHSPAVEGSGAGLADSLRGRKGDHLVEDHPSWGPVDEAQGGSAAGEQVKDDKPPLSHDRALQCVETLQRTLCDPAVLLRFRAAHRLQVKDDKPPLSHDRALQCVETLQRTLCDPAVLLRFRAAHRLGMDTQAEVVPFKMAISLRGQASVDAFTALTALCYSGAFKLLGLRLRPERMQKSPLALAFEEAYLSTSFTDWTRRKPQGNRGSQCKKSQQQQQQQARLKNPHAVCYLNACSQALCWLGMLTAAPQACYGLAQAAFKPLLHAGPLAAPILLPITGSSLQALVDSWSQQASIQALPRIQEL